MPEQGPRTLEHGRVAARHHQKFACLRIFHAARHRRVQHRNALGEEHRLAGARALPPAKALRATAGDRSQGKCRARDSPAGRHGVTIS
jgi:hypothetical protein